MFALAVGKCALYILGSDPAAAHSVLPYSALMYVWQEKLHTLLSHLFL